VASCSALSPWLLAALAYSYARRHAGDPRFAFGVMRLELQSPGVQWLLDSSGNPNGRLYNAIVSAHGLYMMFFVIIPAMFGGLSCPAIQDAWCYIGPAADALKIESEDQPNPLIQLRRRYTHLPKLFCHFSQS
jgi:hypothetical protein